MRYFTSQANWDFFVLISILAFFLLVIFFQLAKASLQQNSIVHFDSIFFSQISWVQKRITGFFSVIFAFWAFFLLFSVFFFLLNYLFFKATISFHLYMANTDFHFLFIILISFVQFFLHVFFLFNILCIVSLSFNPDLYMYKYGIRYCIYV